MKKETVIEVLLKSDILTSTIKLEGSIVVAFSSGVDSTVLLHALTSVMSLASSTVKVIHVHHGLSNHADDWAQHAQSTCAQLSQEFSIDIECIIERVKLDDYSDGLEQAARKVRYDIFEKHCREGDVLLQGHHLDDQIETFFMRALRGSGLTGLSGIPQQRILSRENRCQILRPLLSIEKAQLIEYAEQHQLTWVEDESNADSTIDRNWWRNELLPLIWQRYPDKKQSLARTLDNIQHEHALLQQLIAEKVHLNSASDLQSTDINPALNEIPRFDLDLIRHLGKSIEQSTALSYLRSWLAQYVDILPSAIQMQSIYVDMIQARHDAEPSFSWNGHTLYRYSNCLYLCGEISKKTPLLESWQGQSFDFKFGQLMCAKETLDHGLIPGCYGIRFWQAGDVAKPVGRSTRKMKKWWQDFKVPSWARHYWPLVVDKNTGQIVAVPGLFVCQNYHEQGDGWRLSWSFKRND